MKLTEEQLQNILRNARGITSRVMRRTYVAQYEDVHSAAIEAQLRAAPRWQPERGPFGAYCWRAAVRGAMREMRRNRAPVSASHDPRVLNDTAPVPIMTPTVSDRTNSLRYEERSEVSSRNTSRPDNDYEDEDYKHRVRVELYELLGDDLADLVLAITSTLSSDDYAMANSVDVRVVYDLARKARAKIAKDARLYELWKELK